MQAANKPITAEENKLHNYSAYNPSEKHYDHSRGQADRKDPRRLILSAECQIGKTGAYLHYLSMLSQAANFTAGVDSSSEKVPFPPPIQVNDGWPKEELSWLLPYWQALHSKSRLGKTYTGLLPSKYTKGVATERVRLVKKSCTGGGRWESKYADLLKQPGGEHVQSDAGQGLITKFEMGELDAPFDTQGEPTTACYESLKVAINWDGRFNPELGVQFCACEGHECECEAATAGTSYRKKLILNLTELAATESQQGGVDLRWEAPEHDLHGEKSSRLRNMTNHVTFACRSSCNPLFYKTGSVSSSPRM